MSAIKALVHQQPGDSVLYNVPDRAEAGPVVVASGPDQRQHPMPAAAFPIVPAVAPGVRYQATDVGTDDQRELA
jgi:hypothetical protein